MALSVEASTGRRTGRAVYGFVRVATLQYNVLYPYPYPVGGRGSTGVCIRIRTIRANRTNSYYSYESYEFVRVRHVRTNRTVRIRTYGG